MSAQEQQPMSGLLEETRARLGDLQTAVSAARSSSADDLRRRALGYDTSYGSLADCVMYVHYAGAYAQVAQALLDAGDLGGAEHALMVGFAYAGSAGDCLSEVGIT